MNKQQFRRLATVGAAAALSLQLMAGVASAAVPSADANGHSYDFAGDGWAGFATTLHYTDASTLAKLYLEIDISGASSVGYVGAAKNDNAVNACTWSGTVVKCLFKTVRFNDTLTVEVGAVPSADDVTATGGWSSTGYVVGGNNSHGDAWPVCRVGDTDCRLAADGDPFGYAAGVLYLVASRGSTQGGNYSQGFGNLTLATDQAVDKRTNPQAARLSNLPAGVFSSVNDQASFDDATGFYTVEITVDNGAAHAFQLLIVYPNGTSGPTSFQHISIGYATETYTACAKGDTSDCFTWSNRTNTVTLYLSHNGTLRRSG